MHPLFQQGRIEHLNGVEDGARIEVQHNNDACWAIDASGRHWVRKRDSVTGWESLLAEAASFLLGLELEVRQPTGALFRDNGGSSWMSERIPAVGEHWLPDMRDSIVNLDEVARMIVLDAITCNEDRHSGNILVQPTVDPDSLRLWAIDSGEARIGWVEDFSKLGTMVPNPFNHAPGLPIEVLREDALAAAQVALQIPEATLFAIAEEACSIVQEARVELLTAAMVLRCRNAPQIVSSYLDDLGART